MRLSLASWRFTILTTLGLGAAAACAGNTTGEGSAACRNPKEYRLPDYEQGSALSAPTGFIQCDGGWLHRPSAGTCPSFLPRATANTSGFEGECTQDSDCTAKPNGYCTVESSGDAPAGARNCQYGCTQDSECGPNGMCACEYPVGHCVVADCKVDADCASGLCVGIATQGGGCGPSHLEFACHRSEDACPATASCLQGQGQECQITTDGRRCVNVGICGRPFLVEGTARLAELTPGGSWSAPKNPQTTALSANERELLAQHYARIALMEHASVAAFARFSLELLALAAPAELLRDTQRALGDEIRHAEICFGLAAAYAGRSQRPGPLAMDGALTTPELHAVFKTAFLEACIGETLAAVEVEAALAHALDPEIVSALSGIAQDERRHAELGWRFIRWVLDMVSAEQRAELTEGMLASVCAALDAELRAQPESVDVSENLLRHGLLPEQARSSARRSALEQVCLPCVEALVAAFAPSSVLAA